MEDAGTITYEDVSGVQVADLCGATPPSLHHFEITHDGAALTCAPETLTIKACADASCSTVATSDVSLSLTATGAASTWSQNPITIAGGSSAGVAVELTHTTAETVTLGATGVPIASNPVVCSSPSGCNLSFSEAGFILTLDNHASCSVPNLSIQAVKLSATGTSCAPAYTGNQAVGFSFNYSNPATGSRIPILNAATMAAANVVQNRTINFDGTASAALSFQYLDAGKLNITVSDAAGAGLTSATVSPIVVPAKLIVATVDANNACAGPDYGNCSAFKVAGNTANVASRFNLTVQAACADNTITPNFQLSNIALNSNLVAPALGANGNLSVTSADIVAAGSVTVIQAISEVGAFTITATPGSYLGLGTSPNPISSGTSVTIGRFIPDRFLVVDNSPLFTDATCDFTYQDQPFDFAAGLYPELTLTAVNSAGATTVNYGGSGVVNHDFWKLDSNLLSTRTYSNQVAAFPGTLTATLGVITTAGNNNYDGINSFSFTTDQLSYNKSAVIPVALPAILNDAAFDARVKLNLTIASLTDSDGVAISNAFASTDITGTNIRWGRWFIDNAFGSELQPLQMVAQAQYFDGTNFVINSTDTCSTPVTTTLSNYTGNLAAGETTITPAVMAAGLIPLTLSAPGASNDGATQITLTGFNWMLYDFNADTVADDASAIATFGIFEGRKPVIFWRQKY